MTRIVRLTNVGVKVSVPSKPQAKNKSQPAVSIWERSEPTVIDRKAHNSFINNVFALRGRTSSFKRPVTSKRSFWSLSSSADK